MTDHVQLEFPEPSINIRCSWGEKTQTLREFPHAGTTPSSEVTRYGSKMVRGLDLGETRFPMGLGTLLATIL